MLFFITLRKVAYLLRYSFSAIDGFTQCPGYAFAGNESDYKFRCGIKSINFA